MDYRSFINTTVGFRSLIRLQNNTGILSLLRRFLFSQEGIDGVRQIPDRFGIPVLQHIDDFRESGHCEAADERHHLARLRDDLHIARLADCDEHQRMNPPRIAAEDRTVNNLPRVIVLRRYRLDSKPSRPATQTERNQRSTMRGNGLWSMTALALL